MPTKKQIERIANELKKSGCDGCRFASSCPHYLERQQVLFKTPLNPHELLRVAQEFDIMV